MKLFISYKLEGSSHAMLERAPRGCVSGEPRDHRSCPLLLAGAARQGAHQRRPHRPLLQHDPKPLFLRKLLVARA